MPNDDDEKKKPSRNARRARAMLMSGGQWTKRTTTPANDSLAGQLFLECLGGVVGPPPLTFLPPLSFLQVSGWTPPPHEQQSSSSRKMMARYLVGE
jgi:hypothetical protein